VTIPLVEDGTALDNAFKDEFAAGVDVVIDYLWGPSAERLMLAGPRRKRRRADPVCSGRFGERSEHHASERCVALVGDYADGQRHRQHPH
jgi:hypothetical protein